MKKNIYIDGSVINNQHGKKVGWSFIITDINGKILQQKYGRLVEEADINKAELEALYQALQCVEDTEDEYIIVTDSEVIAKSVIGENKRNSNRGYWKEIENLFEKKVGYFDIKHINSHKYVKGCLDHKFNNMADKLAKKAGNSLLLQKIQIR